MPDRFSFVGVGNAAMDIICEVPDAFITALNLPRSSCAFPDLAGVASIESALETYGITPIYEPGGSAANTASTIAALGDHCAFLGKTSDDDYGRRFIHSIDRWHIIHPLPPMDPGIAPSTRIYTFITPDKDRTFAAYHGAACHLGADDMQGEIISKSACLYLDGYLLAEQGGVNAALAALALAQKHDVMRVFNPSALSVIDTWQDQLRRVMASCDGVICNAQEAKALTGFDDPAKSVATLAEGRRFAAVTLAADGALAQAGDQTAHCPNPKLTRPLVNTNGAGDNFAGGFLYGFIRDWALDRCVRLGLACAVNVLGETGPRPSASLAHLLEGI